MNKAQIGEHSLLRTFYDWEGLTYLVQVAFGIQELHQSADPAGAFYYNYFQAGDQLGWHFDRSEYAVNLILQEPRQDEGGEFQ